MKGNDVSFHFTYSIESIKLTVIACKSKSDSYASGGLRT